VINQVLTKEHISTKEEEEEEEEKEKDHSCEVHISPYKNIWCLILPVDRDARTLPRQTWIDSAPC